MNNENTTPGSRPLRVLISGGGTGGHIFPALSIANEVRRRHPEADILFVGAEGRMEMERVPAAGYEIKGLPVAGFDRKRLWRNFAVLAKLFKSMRRARRILRDFRPDIAVGVGGYASGPMLKEAQKAGIPTLLQEQNSYAGVTNKLLAKKAAAICVAYDGMERFFPAEVILKTGNPIRADLTRCTLTPEQAKERLGFDPKRPLVFVTGGSLGARTVNEAVAAALPRLAAEHIQVLWKTGKLYAERCEQVAREYADVHASAFVSDMAVAYRAADLVVARAGASTISELQILGQPAVLIPSPNVAENHQYHNARAVSDAGGAVLIEDHEAVSLLADEVIALVGDAPVLQKMSDSIRAQALTDAAAVIADKIEEITSAKAR